MRPRAGRSVAFTLVLLSAASAACRAVTAPRYEYEEELYLSLDGSATLNVNASVPALVALQNADLPLDPTARLDRERVRALYTAPGITPSVTLSRRDGRRYVHVSIDVDDVHTLGRIPALGWSRYQLRRGEDVVEYRQAIGAARGREVGDVGWGGREVVGFRMHVPSEILFHNTGSPPQRGNILEWEQPLAARMAGEPLELQVRMEPESILYTTLLLFAGTIAAAAITFAAVVWWIVKRGRGAPLAESHP